MRTPQSLPNDPKLKERMEKSQQQDHKVEHLFRRILHWIERAIAFATIVILLIVLGLEFYKMFQGSLFDLDVNAYLHSILTIVVGLEFVRMLIDTTPASILEVLTVAITRHVILNHENAWSNLVCVICIAGLFAIRRFLVRRSELKEEMVEMD